jgi:hypothetical protein
MHALSGDHAHQRGKNADRFSRLAGNQIVSMSHESIPDFDPMMAVAQILSKFEKLL